MMSLRCLDWVRLGRAVDFYQTKGYEFLGAPWVVDPEFCDMTYPLKGWYRVWSGSLVGSAEQSLLSMFFKREHDFEPGKGYVVCSPCFREEPVHDDLHLPYFMKVELFKVVAPDAARLTMLEEARSFFAFEAGVRPRLEKTAEGWDLTINGIEVGSYGIRTVTYKDRTLHWEYATGLAEPRFSQALEIPL